MNVTMTREEVRSLLNVTENTFKSIVKEKKLEKRLKNKGLELVKKYKIGRNVVYELSPTELSYWQKVQSHYNVKKQCEHDAYTIARLTNKGLEKSRASIIRDNDIDISGKTAKKFDDILENEGIIVKDKTVYALYNKQTGTFDNITEEEYKSFWKDVSFCKELLYEQRRKLNKKEISQDTYDYRNYVIIDQVGREKGEVAVKFDTYKELQDTKELIDMIKKHQEAKNK